MEYLNRGVPTLGICIYRLRVIQEAPRWWLLHTKAHRRFLSLSPPTDQASGLCCASRSGKKSPCKKKKQKQKSSLEEPSRLGSPGCLPLSSDGNLLPPFSSLLDRRPEAVHRFWTQQLKVQQGYESNREGALSLSITGQWRRGCPLRSWAGKAQGLRETRQHF